MPNHTARTAVLGITCREAALNAASCLLEQQSARQNRSTLLEPFNGLISLQEKVRYGPWCAAIKW